ncbi:MAG: hypothetical protein LBC77_04695 [Spirochaetaceae bacterium]|jgi:hypothetical protein|nr:hypothetical protein [Spirochaetaceae bacterium]
MAFVVQKWVKRSLPRRAVWVFAAAFFVFSCDYGIIGGADKTETFLPHEALFARRLDSLRGVWYSHYAGMGRLDGYRIGQAESFSRWGKARAKALFPEANFEYMQTCTGDPVVAGDYIIIYDDTVFGQADDAAPTQASWGFAYIGVARALNIFNGDLKRGAIIIEYLEGCAPEWLNKWPASREERVPFFGIYYRELSQNVVQMANAVDLAALYAGEPYYTEKATLDAAIACNNIENEAEYISWGVVIPQDRE